MPHGRRDTKPDLSRPELWLWLQVDRGRHLPTGMVWVEGPHWPMQKRGRGKKKTRPKKKIN